MGVALEEVLGAEVGEEIEGQTLLGPDPTNDDREDMDYAEENKNLMLVGTSDAAGVEAQRRCRRRRGKGRRERRGW